MKMSIIFILASIYSFPSFAQATVKTVVTTQSTLQATNIISPSIIEPLSVGDKVPDIEFTMLNYPLSKARISDFRGKMVILDFWSTWCTACLKHFSKLDSIQHEFNPKLQILLINSIKGTGDKEKAIKMFLRKWKKTFPTFNLPTAVEDSLAYRYFIHKSLPHYVWITPDGNVLSITSSDYITRENIIEAIKGSEVHLPVKIDFSESKNLYPGNDSLIKSDSYFSWFHEGEIVGARPINRFRISGQFMRGLAMRNISILEMYKRIFEINGVIAFDEKRLVLETNDVSKLHRICTYDLIIPEDEQENLYSLMVKDFNNYSRLVGIVQERPFKHLKLIRTSSTDKIGSKGGASEDKLSRASMRLMKNVSVSHLISVLSQMDIFELPIVDGTNYLSNVDIEIPERYENIERLRDVLRKYDLDLVEVNEPLKIFIIADSVDK